MAPTLDEVLATMYSTLSDRITEMLSDLERDRFFGVVEIKFEAGRVVLLRKTETIKPDQLNHRNNRGDVDGKH